MRLNELAGKVLDVVIFAGWIREGSQRDSFWSLSMFFSIWWWWESRMEFDCQESMALSFTAGDSVLTGVAWGFITWFSSGILRSLAQYLAYLTISTRSMPMVVLPSIFSSFLCGFFSHYFHLKSYCETQATLTKTDQRSSEACIQANTPFSCKITEHGKKQFARFLLFYASLLPVGVSVTDMTLIWSITTLVLPIVITVQVILKWLSHILKSSLSQCWCWQLLFHQAAWWEAFIWAERVAKVF